MTISQSTIASLRTTPPTAEQDRDLKESLKRDGWWEDHPLIQDEHGVILVGNRRKKFALEMAISPVVVTVTFGDGEDADDKRVRRALDSNASSSGTTAEDRKALAIKLHQTEGWVQERIARIVGVSQRMVSEYLRGLEPTSKPDRPKGGRPKEGPKPAAAPKPIRIVADGPPAKPPTVSLASVKPTQYASPLAEQLSVKAATPLSDVREALAVLVVDSTSDFTVAATQARKAVERAVGKIVDKLDGPKFQTLVQKARRTEAEIRAEVSKRVEASESAMRKKFSEEYPARAAEYAKLIAARDGIYDPDEFNKILKVMHPDFWPAISGEKKAAVEEAFRLVNEAKFILVNPDRPQQRVRLAADKARMKEAVRKRDEKLKAQADARKAKRKAKKSGTASPEA